MSETVRLFMWAAASHAHPSVPQQPPAQPNTAVSIRLGEWNMKKLGHGTTKRYDLLARVVEADFDIVVITEVMQLRRGHPGYERLLAELGAVVRGRSGALRAVT